MNCYKGFDKDLKCRDFQYEVGKEYTEEKADICERGFHACESPLDVFSYYPPGNQSRYCEVDLDANDQRSADSKRVGKYIKISAEIGIKGLIKAHFDYVKKHVNESIENGDSEAATSRGKSVVGENGLAVARGNDVLVKGGLGSILVIAEEKNDSYDIESWKAVIVDGKTVKADTFYRLVNGELKEVEE